MQIDKFYTLEQASDILQIKERTLAEHVRAGTIKAHKRFGKWFVFHSTLKQYIENGTTNLENESNQMD